MEAAKTTGSCSFGVSVSKRTKNGLCPITPPSKSIHDHWDEEVQMFIDVPSISVFLHVHVIVGGVSGFGRCKGSWPESMSDCEIQKSRLTFETTAKSSIDAKVWGLRKRMNFHLIKKAVYASEVKVLRSSL